MPLEIRFRWQGEVVLRSVSCSRGEGDSWSMKFEGQVDEAKMYATDRG